MKYPFVFYANWPVPKSFAGAAYGPICFIRPEYRDDDGLRAHESLHATDWWRFCLAGLAMVALVELLTKQPVGSHAYAYVLAVYSYSILYSFSNRFCLWAEAKCYARQALFYRDDRRSLFALFISRNYGLDVTTPDALAAINAAFEREVK